MTRWPTTFAFWEEHDKGTGKYDKIWIEATSLSSNQHAPIMIDKRAIYETEIAAERIVVCRCGAVASDNSATQETMAACRSACAHQKVGLGAEKYHYTLEGLNAKCVPTVGYYLQPLYQKTCYSKFLVANNGFRIRECFFNELLSVPVHPHLKEVTEYQNCKAVRDTIPAISRAERCG